MTRIPRLAAVITGLGLLLSTTLTWCQIPNPTVSDANANTAGGTNALINLDETASGGFNNTAFGSACAAATPLAATTPPAASRL